MENLHDLSDLPFSSGLSNIYLFSPYSGNIFPVQNITLAVPSKFGEENLPELSVLPAVDQDVDAGVEHQEDVGDLHEEVTPA